MQLYDNATSVTTSDTTVVSPPYDAFMVSVAGNVAVRMTTGTVITFTGCLVGTVYPMRIDKVMASSTTATGIIGLRLGPRQF
jgi:hypothetical protein